MSHSPAGDFCIPSGTVGGSLTMILEIINGIIAVEIGVFLYGLYIFYEKIKKLLP